MHRHDSVLHCFYTMLKAVNFRCRKEILEQFEGKQRPDIAVYDYRDGKKLLLDITITHPQSKRFVGVSCSVVGHAANEKEKMKNICRRPSTGAISFVLFLLKCSGNWKLQP